MISPVNKSELFASLPAPWPEDLLPRIRGGVAKSRRKVVVLDDDPTGTQTVYDVPVLTTWQPEELARELANELPCFYLLTNTRAFPAAEAVRINQEIARNLTKAAMRSPGRSDLVVVSRSDSTLRGHFPVETNALLDVLGPFDATILFPYFEAGGRYTVNDIHYVADSDTLVPAAETPFAKDTAFGYRSSNLREYVEEKTGGRVKAANVSSISIAELRAAAPNHEPTRAITTRLLGLKRGSICVVNACHPRDAEFFALGALVAEQAGARFLYRTAAQFVAARLGQEPRPLWCPAPPARPGGLTVVGSHVPKTTGQLEALLSDAALERVELCVDRILAPESRTVELSRAVQHMNLALAAGRDVVVFTSRGLVTGGSSEASLVIGQRVSEALVELVQSLQTRPGYVIAKGGITSSVLATHGLGVKRAMVLGQILPGVPVWELGAETKFPGLPYVVFPGNVGGPEALREVVLKLRA